MGIVGRFGISPIAKRHRPSELVCQIDCLRIVGGPAAGAGKLDPKVFRLGQGFRRAKKEVVLGLATIVVEFVHRRLDRVQDSLVGRRGDLLRQLNAANAGFTRPDADFQSR